MGTTCTAQVLCSSRSKEPVRDAAVREVHGTSTRCLGLMRRGVGAAGMGAEEAGMMPGIEGDAMAEEEDAELKGGGARLEAEAEGLEEIEGLAGFSDFYAC